MTARSALTQDALKSALSYDPLTGEFRWLSGYSNPHIGKRAGALTTRKKYWRIGVLGHYYSAHHLAWLYVYGVMPKYLDHIDGNRTNNRIENLRIASGSQNNMNATLRSDNSSGIKGVRWAVRQKKWRVVIGAYGVQYHIGYFKSIFDAEAARILAAKRIHGEFARHASREML